MCSEVEQLSCGINMLIDWRGIGSENLSVLFDEIEQTRIVE
jgi:hypothetical protein